MRAFLRALLIAIAVLLAIVTQPSIFVWAGEKPFIILQSTTSTRNSGLFDFILPKFTAEHGIDVRVVAVGTGQALTNGRKGDGDVLLVHAKSAEQAFVRNGYGVERFDVMYNDFVIVGPMDDPAKVDGTNNVLDALANIAKSNSPFVSRGDDSGTHRKELSLWAGLGIDVQSRGNEWYREAGSGMGATLNIASGMGAYTLTDRGTWIAFANKADMKIISQGDPRLFNQYGVILVNGKIHPHVKTEAGNNFIQWLLGLKGQTAIAAYKLQGRQLFFPNAKN